jgi:hypothetical protein
MDDLPIAIILDDVNTNNWITPSPPAIGGSRLGQPLAIEPSKHLLIARRRQGDGCMRQLAAFPCGTLHLASKGMHKLMMSYTLWTARKNVSGDVGWGSPADRVKKTIVEQTRTLVDRNFQKKKSS